MYERLIEKLRANPQSYYLIKDEEEFEKIYNCIEQEERLYLKYNFSIHALCYSKVLNGFTTYRRNLVSHYLEITLEKEEESLKDLEPLFKQSKLSEDKKILILPEGKWELIDNKLVCYE